MSDYRRSMNLFLTIALALPIAVFLATALSGCPQPQNPQNRGKESEVGALKPFAWDNMRRQPRWRINGSIGWHKTDDQAAVIEAARSAGKPILAYVSRYDSGLTATIEDGLLRDDAWGAIIKDQFIPWEINWWEDPPLAQTILVADQAPALIALRVSPDPGSTELRRMDIWGGQQIISFPLHDAPIPLGNPQAMARIASFATVDWTTLQNPELRSTEVASSTYTDEVLRGIGPRYERGEGLMPEEGLLFALRELQFGNEAIGFNAQVYSWHSHLQDMSVESVWLADIAFSPQAGWSVDPVRNLESMACVLETGTGLPVSNAKLNDTLNGWLTMQDGNLGGGFPAYIDIRNTFTEGPSYLGIEAELPAEIRPPFPNALTGPRDIVWVNARLLTWWLRLNKADPAFTRVGLPGQTAAIGFLPCDCEAFLGILLEKAGPTAQMKLADKTYLLSALDELYQLTGDSLLLSRAGEIAATFTVETAQTWFDPRMYPMLPDLAIALHYYGWLAEDKPAKDAARYITDHLLNYGPSLPVLDQVRLVYANEIVHSKCIHAAVIGAPDDPKIPDFLSAALEGWDPRKIAQALDPTTDAELIDAKGYSAQTSAVTYICIDDVCYAPCRDAAKIKETIEQAVKDLQAEVNGMSAPKSAPAS